MNKRLTMRVLPLVLSSLFAVSAANAQNVSSAVNGRVLDATGQPMSGAKIEILHVPSGTVSVVTADEQGRYKAAGLRVGGPYRITAEGATSITKDDVYLRLAESTTVNIDGPASDATLETITVTANAADALFSTENMGIGTNVDSAQIAAMPSSGRNIQDIIRLDPRVAQTSKADGRISAGGQNSRYNLIRIDGVSTNDPFGLEANGLPTERQPVSMDAIEEINISLANYDVTTAGGTGAVVNAVTKSGTNDFHGSVYYSFRDKDWVRKDLEGVPFNGFNNERTYGATLGGAIVQDKLFFFANYEKYIRSAPGTSLASTPYGRGQITDADISAVQGAASAYGFDAGSLGSLKDSKTEIEEYAVKLDWNISDAHRASLRYSNLDQTVLRQPGIGSSSISLSSYWYNQPKTFETYVGQLFSDWTENFSTELKVSYRDYNASRATLSNLPSIRINYGNQALYLGTEVNSHINIVDTVEKSIFAAGTYFLGDHSIKFGVDLTRNDIINYYGRDLNGSYTFQSFDDFVAGTPSQYTVRAPRPGRGYDDIPAAYQFENSALFIQDRWAVNYNLNLMFGLRLDVPNYPDKPLYNETIQQMYGYDNSVTIDSKLWQPRFGMNYSFDTVRSTQLRGGVGLFQGAAPNVWTAGAYQNTGLNFIAYDLRNPGAIFDPTRVVIPDNLPGGTPRQRVDLNEPGLALPSSWKANLALDHELPWNGIVASAELLVSKTKDDIYFESLDLGTSTYVGPDGRVLYWNAAGIDPTKVDGTKGIQNGKNTVINRANRPSNIDQIMLARNTDKGQSRQVTLSLSKPGSPTDHWSWMGAYTYTHATQVSPMASSQNTSNWNGTPIYQVNENVAGNSRYAIRDRFTGMLTYQNKWFGDNKTSFGMFYEGRSGLPFSYIYYNDANGDGAGTNDLFYVPNGRGDVLFTGGQAMEDAFFDWLQKNPDLGKYAGRVVPSNSSTSRWVNNFDLRISQEIPSFVQGQKGEFTFDIMNVGNLLNKNWGLIKDYGFYQTRRVANYAGIDPETGKYVYTFTDTDEQGIQENNNDKGNTGVSRWSVQATFHYRF